MIQSDGNDDDTRGFAPLAFPCADRGDGHSDPGMTLLDYIAAKALLQLMAENVGSSDVWSEDEIARLAYDQAEAMVAESRRRQA